MQIMQQETINKSIILDFYRRAVAQGDIAFAEQIIADDYIQHSLMVKPGKAGLLEALSYMKQMPKPANPAKPFMRLIAEGEYVVTNMSFGWGDKQKAVVDLFRMQDGKVIEHWDVIQDQPETTLNGNAFMNGSMPLEDAALTIENKAIATDFCQQIFVDRQLDKLPDFVAPDLIQHNPEIVNGVSGLKDYLGQQAEFSIEKVQRIIAEGDFAVVQSEGKWHQNPGLFYDIFRLSEGKIVEQWGVKQTIP
ncbi:nuclear transport factor 2 family protein [Spirosoma harenae]